MCAVVLSGIAHGTTRWTSSHVRAARAAICLSGPTSELVAGLQSGRVLAAEDQFAHGPQPGRRSPGCGWVPCCPTSATVDAFLGPETLTDRGRLSGLQLIAVIIGLELRRGAL